MALNDLPASSDVSLKYMLSGDMLAARLKRGWTQAYASECISITSREYQSIEGGKRLPNIITFLKILFLFELDIEKYREVVSFDIPVSPC